jgi:mannonate dehydratase
MTEDPLADRPIRAGIRFNALDRERLRYATQVGATEVIVHPFDQSYMPSATALPTDGSVWAFDDLVQLRNRIADAGCELVAIENLPRDMYDQVVLGGPEREAQLERVQETVRNVGRAGIDVIGYNWMPNRVWRSSLTRPDRGGAETTAYEHDEMADAPPTHGGTYEEDAMWERYESFLDAVLPVAEAEGVTLALHADDPPVARLGGIPRLFRSVDRVERALDLVPSDNHGVELSLGVFSEMGADVVEAVERFGERDAIAYVHFRDVEGTAHSFQETFLDRGNYDETAVIAALDRVDFDGVLIPDHVPTIAGEREWGPSGTAYTVGYIRGLLRMHYAGD